MKRFAFLALFAGLIIAVHAQEITQAVFESCAGCRLNAMPEAKKFLREEVEPGQWGESVSVSWIPGHNPEVAFKTADGTEVQATGREMQWQYGLIDQRPVERLPLWQKSYSDLVELLESKGFSREAPAEGEEATAQEGGGEL